jgi:hypothetical protein
VKEPIMRFIRTLALALVVGLAASIASSPVLAGAVRADVAARVAGQYSATSGLGSTSFVLDQQILAQFSPGTGVGKADLAFADRRTLAASATENLDLAGVLIDPLGATLTFGHVKAIYVVARPGNTNNVVVGGAVSNGFAGPFGGTTPTVAIPPGGALLLTHAGAGWAVTPATGDLLKVLNSGSGTSVQYDVIIIGTSL